MPLKNFGVVYRQAACNGNAILTRSGQPDKEGFGSLWLLGIRTVIKLNEDSEFKDATEKEMFEEMYGYSNGEPRVKLWPLPEIFRAEYTDNIVMLVCSIMDELRTRSVHIHCVHGTDRTGLVCAAFMLLNGAPLESVIKYRAEFGVNEFRDLIDYQDHPVIQEIKRRVDAGMLPPKGVNRV
jgi:protein-tyrosine phosphatase